MLMDTLPNFLSSFYIIMKTGVVTIHIKNANKLRTKNILYSASRMSKLWQGEGNVVLNRQSEDSLPQWLGHQCGH